MKNIPCFLVLLIGIYSCAPDPAQELTSYDTDMVATWPDEEYDFSRDSVFILYDKILELQEDTIILSDSDLDRKIIQEVYNNMIAYGYVPSDSTATDTTNPDIDIALVLTKFQGQNIQGAQNGGTWYGYPAYWNPWYVGYPGTGWYFPGYTYIYSYQTGAVVIAMFDWSKRNQETQIPIWEAGIGGVLEGNDIENRVLWGVDQAFGQSSYLDQTN